MTSSPVAFVNAYISLMNGSLDFYEDDPKSHYKTIYIEQFFGRKLQTPLKVNYFYTSYGKIAFNVGDDYYFHTVNFSDGMHDIENNFG